MSNLLFICSKNQWRSPTAAALFINHPVHRARSAGTSDKARIKASQKLINWADVILVMESKHRELLRQRFSQGIKNKKLVVLNIDDNYKFDDPELIRIFKDALGEYL